MVIIPTDEQLAEYERMKATGKYTKEDLSHFLYGNTKSLHDVFRESYENSKKRLNHLFRQAFFSHPNLITQHCTECTLVITFDGVVLNGL